MLPDGYHEIKTIFAEIDVADVLKYTLTRTKNIEILTNVNAISNQDNLAVKVASFIQEKYQVPYGVRIELKKNIPLAAGMGGGSSNAAVTIRSLSDLWELKLPEAEMMSIAAKYGSDVPFFLYGGTMLGSHKGEKLALLAPFIWNYILLVKPYFGVSASEAYASVEYNEKATNWEQLISSGDVKMCFNRLQAGVIRQYPVIGEIITEMNKTGAIKTIMTGSGSTCVGFYNDSSTMQKAKDHFEIKDYWTCCTKTRNQSNMNFEVNE